MSTPNHPPIASFAHDVRATLAVWLPSLLVAAAACVWLERRGFYPRLAEGVGWLAIGFVLLPLLFTSALAVCAALLTALLGLLAVPTKLLGRPSGIGPVLRDLWRLAGHVVPGFWRALRRVQRPALWGALAGVAIATVALGWWRRGLWPGN